MVRYIIILAICFSAFAQANSKELNKAIEVNNSDKVSTLLSHHSSSELEQINALKVAVLIDNTEALRSLLSSNLNVIRWLVEHGARLDLIQQDHAVDIPLHLFLVCDETLLSLLNYTAI